MKNVIMYSQGLVSASVCADNSLSVEDVTAEINKTNPTGLDHGWQFADGENFQDGNANPCPCNHYADSRKHYLFHC